MLLASDWLIKCIRVTWPCIPNDPLLYTQDVYVFCPPDRAMGDNAEEYLASSDEVSGKS